MDNFNINAWTEEQEKKDIIRPILIAYGNAKRVQSKKQYWINKIARQIHSAPCDVALISDLRFATDETDECAWVKKSKGLHLHIRRHTKVGNKKIYQEAPNEFEKENEPRLIESASYVADIPFMDEDKFKEEIKKISIDFISKNFHYFL
jgi:L-cysteine desulfidase